MSQGDLPQLPQSSALAEASVDSLSDLMALDPEKMTPEHRGRIIVALRDQSARWAAAEAEGATKPRGKAKALPSGLKTIAPGTADEMVF